MSWYLVVVDFVCKKILLIVFVDSWKVDVLKIVLWYEEFLSGLVVGKS